MNVLTLGSQILTFPSCDVANMLLVTLFHFTCDAPPKWTKQDTFMVCCQQKGIV